MSPQEIVKPLHIPGTIYPINGAPHYPSMCSHRTIVRGNGYHRTALCYERGLYELVCGNGQVSTILTAEGAMPNLRCERHVSVWAESYAPDRDGRCVTVRMVETIVCPTCSGSGGVAGTSRGKCGACGGAKRVPLLAAQHAVIGARFSEAK
jgi:hypothetical protein